MADTKTYNIGKWDTFHNNGPFPTKILFETSLERAEKMPSKTDRYNDAAKEIQRLLQDSIDNKHRFRAYGSAWSLSNIAHSSDRMHYNARMNIMQPIEAQDLHPKSSYKKENLFLIQCGATIKEINEFLFSKGKSLKASGASNGQTIAGAISTGVHGAAFDTGAIHDGVVGLNLIIGPGEKDIVYIERHTKPALTDDFAKKINSRIIRNDGLFDAAVVSLGSFGFIHSVILEAEDLYLLKRYTRRITKKQALEIGHSMNFRDAEFTISSELDAEGKGNRPYHFKLYINPYNENEDYVTEIIYKKTYRDDYPNPIPKIKTAIYKDLPTWIAKFASKHSRLIPKFIKALKGQIFPDIDEDIEGTLGEIFWDSTHQGPAFACSIAVDNKDFGKALDIFIKLVNEDGPVPGAIGVRFVKQSKGTLAFTKFPVTCIVEMDGIQWQGNNNMISQEEFERRLVEVYIEAGIKFTTHWGKNFAWSFPGLIDYMYGDKDDTWKDYRSALLTKQTADIFSNDFLNATKLSDYRVNVSADLIKSIEPG